MSAPGPGISAQLVRSVVRHYEAQLARHGPTARGMDWKDEASQELRFRVLCDVCELDGCELREIGCGAGHLVDHLRRRGVGVRYSGVDLSPAMVEAARRRHPDAEFVCADLLREELPPVDVALCSGLFHVKLDHGEVAWWEFVSAMLRRMFAGCRRAIAFNLMTDQVDTRAPQLFYAAPGEVLDFCRRELSRFVTLRHDYPLYEFTVYVYRDAARP